jgi:hypothetical protein
MTGVIPRQCDSINPGDGERCELPKGHQGRHSIPLFSISWGDDETVVVLTPLPFLKMLLAQQIQARQKMKSQLVGSLYPSILEDEIAVLQSALLHFSDD